MVNEPSALLSKDILLEEISSKWKGSQLTIDPVENHFVRNVEIDNKSERSSGVCIEKFALANRARETVKNPMLSGY
jgi:hypothetical protein